MHLTDMVTLIIAIFVAVIVVFALIWLLRNLHYYHFTAYYISPNGVRFSVEGTCNTKLSKETLEGMFRTNSETAEFKFTNVVYTKIKPILVIK